jgi:hypothetical protein
MTPRYALYCILGGLVFSMSALGTGYFDLWWISGVIISAALLPVVRFGPRSLLAQFGMIFLALTLIGTFCTLSEAAVFFPEMRPQLIMAVVIGAMMNLIAAAVLVRVGKLMKLGVTEGAPVLHRSAAMTVLFVLLTGASYVLYYEITGAITFQLFTRQYYPHAVEQAMAMGYWFPLYQWARGVTMTLAVLPIILSLRLPRWQAALVVGMIVWIVGGGASLLVPNTMMVATQRYIHIVEIMTQNVPLGITAVLLLRPRAFVQGHYATAA